MVLVPLIDRSQLATMAAGIRQLACIWLVCLFCAPVQGQQAVSMATPDNASPQSFGQIEGEIKDAESGEPLPLATIRLLNASLSGVTADINGYFSLSGLPVGQYTLVASYAGYQDMTLEQITVSAGQRQFATFALRPSPQMIEEVVVTASLRSQAIKLAPASIGVVTAKQLQERQVTTFDQAFDEMPGVVVTRSGGANVQAFSIRGASEVAGGGIGNRVLLLIDGRPALSPESGGALWNLVPVSSIERIEVVRGAYSSLYGSSAMGGVVNVITRDADLKPQTRIHLNYGAYNHAPVSTGYRRYNDFRSIDLSHSRRVGKFSYVLDGSWKTDDGHKEKTGFDLYNLFGKATWALNPRRQIQLALNANRMYSDAPATWLSKRQAYSATAFKQDDYQDRREFNADLYYTATPNDRVKYSTRLYHYNSTSLFSFDDNPGNDSTNINFGKQIVKSYSVHTQRLGALSQVELFLGKHYLITGIDIKGDYVLGTPDTFLYGEHRALGTGVFAQDEVSITKRLTLTAGLRYDHYVIFGQVQESNLSPKLALLYQAKPKLSLRMLLAQAFRDPPIAERFIKFEQGGGLRFLPNPSLRPERLIVSAEIGAKMQPLPGGTFDVSFFYNRYNNLISFQQLSNPLEPLLYKVVNLKESVMQGVELSYRQQLKEYVTLQFSYTFLDARDISDNRVNDALAYKVRHTLGASATVRHKGFTFNANTRYRSRIEEVFIYPGSEPDAVFLVNTKVAYTFAKGYSAYFAVNNVNNAQYEELERYRMPGRSFTGGVEWRF
jgi:outer membrane receptor protein involved in Fe transport